MSVLLEGKIENVYDSNASAIINLFSGKWRFMKENKIGNLNFTFTKVSSSIPRSLFNYVSFIDDGTSSFRHRGKCCYFLRGIVLFYCACVDLYDRKINQLYMGYVRS